MAQRIVVSDLADAPLDAAAEFHRDWLAKVRAASQAGEDALTVILPPCDYTHKAWRRAAAQALAREAAPAGRVNVIAAADEGEAAALCDYLERAPGVTGQYLEGAGAAEAEEA